jgi:3-oxoacyl-[acyl-carrier-protein] synthase II
MHKRVVITGIGVISPIGTGKEKFWNALISGKNGVRRCKKLGTSKYQSHVAAEVKDFAPNKFISRNRLKGLTLTTQYAIASAKMALDDSGATLFSGNKAGVVLGANTADPLAHASAAAFWVKKGYSSTPAKIYKNLNTNFQAVKIAEYFGLEGPCTVIPAACAAGNVAIAYAFDAIICLRAVMIRLTFFLIQVLISLEQWHQNIVSRLIKIEKE